MAELLVRLLADSGHLVEASEAAREFGVNDRGLEFLARRWVQRHPADAIPILLREANLAIDRRRDNYGYTQAAKVLAVLDEVHRQAGLDFADGLERFKAAYHHRRPLLTALANVGL